MNNIMRSGLTALSFGFAAALLLSVPALAGGHDRNTKGGVSLSTVGQAGTDDQSPFDQKSDAADPGDQKDKKKERAQEQRAQRPDHGQDQDRNQGQDDQRGQRQDRNKNQN